MPLLERKQPLIVEFQDHQILQEENIHHAQHYTVSVTFQLDVQRLTVGTSLRLMCGEHFVAGRNRSLQIQLMHHLNKLNTGMAAAEFAVEARSGVVRLRRSTVLSRQAFLQMCANLNNYLNREVG